MGHEQPGHVGRELDIWQGIGGLGIALVEAKPVLVVVAEGEAGQLNVMPSRGQKTPCPDPLAHTDAT